MTMVLFYQIYIACHMLPSDFTGKSHVMSTFTANYRLYDNGAWSTKYISLAIWWLLILQEDILFTSLHFQKDATKLQAYIRLPIILTVLEVLSCVNQCLVHDISILYLE
jgi:hypothetical protein